MKPETGPRLIYGVGPPDALGRSVIVAGISREVWLEMIRRGSEFSLDLRPFGVFVEVVLFGAESAQKCAEWIGARESLEGPCPKPDMPSSMSRPPVSR